MTDDLITEINNRFKKALAKDPNVLTCIVTGRTRPTNASYLEEKAKVAGTKEEFIKHYICRDALTLLKQGKSVYDIRHELGSSADVPLPDQTLLQKALEINGK